MGARTERDPKLAGAMTYLEAEHHKISALARQFQEAVQNDLQEVEVSRSAFEGSMSSSAAGEQLPASRPSTKPGSLEELIRGHYPDLTDEELEELAQSIGSLRPPECHGEASRAPRWLRSNDAGVIFEWI